MQQTKHNPGAMMPAGITIPIVIGYLVQRTGSYRLALIYVGVTALLASPAMPSSSAQSVV